MSDDYNPLLDDLEGGAPPSQEDPTGAPTEEGQPTDGGLQDEIERQYLELDEDIGNRYVRVKIDGQEHEVPLQEALAGYQRQADYTRKTQELAQQRQQIEFARALQTALQAEPEETLRLLARQYKVQFDPQPQGQQQPQPQRASDPYGFSDEPDPYEQDDPVARRIAELEQRIAAQDQFRQQEQADRVLRAAVGGLQQKYQADDATVREVVQRALQRRQGPEMFETIYKEIAYDRAQEARRAREAANTADDQRRVAAKSQAQQLVSSGGSAAGGGVPPPADPGERALTLEEAFALAEQQAGSPWTP